MKNKRILLIGGNFYPESTGIGKFNGEMVDWLSLEGNDCSVISTYPYYPFWELQAPYRYESYWFKTEKRILSEKDSIKIYRCPHYIPKIPCGKKRIFSDMSYFISAFFQIFFLLFKKKYDYVITVAPPFQLGLLGLLYKWIKNAKFIYHVQDLQIDAAHKLGMIKSATLVKVMFGIERFILKHSDHVSSISEGMIKNLKAKYKRPILLFPNSVDIKSYYPIVQTNETRGEFDLSINDKVVLYSGAIGEKQGIQTLLHAAKKLSNIENLKFIICGAGPYKNNLILLAKEMNLSNVIFLPLQPREIFNKFLNLADIHLILQKVNANDLVLPSKLTNILSVGGIALVAAEPDTSLHSIIYKNKIGIIIEPENVDVLSAAIINEINNPQVQLRNNARAYAENHLTINKVLSKYFTQVNNEVITPSFGQSKVLNLEVVT